MPWFAVLPTGEWGHFRVKSNWPETLCEWADWPDITPDKPRIRLTPGQVKELEVLCIG